MPDRTVLGHKEELLFLWKREVAGGGLDWRSWWPPFIGKKRLDQDHGRSTARTARGTRSGGGGFFIPGHALGLGQHRAGVPAQGPEECLKGWAVFGMKEAIVADFDKAVGQDMLEEAGEELERR